MATITTQITVPEAQLPLIQDAATEQGKSVSEFLSAAIGNGQSIQGIANDRANQAWWRLQQAGEIPAEVLAESRRHAEANAPKKDPAPGASA
jgi:hypothetical protein